MNAEAIKCFSDIVCVEFPSNIPCVINIIENEILVNGMPLEGPLALIPDTAYTLRFIYKVGYPNAIRFHLFFYEDPEDVRDVMTGIAAPETHAITPNPPIIFSFDPEHPHPDATGILEQKGTLFLRTPPVDPAHPNRKYYPILAMEMPESDT